MDDDTAKALRALLDQEPVAALATLHRGEPAASMVPFVLDEQTGVAWLHVSGLATHTRDMQQHPRVSLLVIDRSDASVPPQALPRVSLVADARRLPNEDPTWPRARDAYLARFPQAEVTFALSDFSIVELSPVSARLIAGFGKAYSLVGAPLRAWLRREPAAE